MKSLHSLLISAAFLLFFPSILEGQKSIKFIKLFRFGNPGNEKPGVLTADGVLLNVSAFGEDYNEAFFEKDGIKRLTVWLSKNATKCPKVDPKTRLASCIARPSKIIAIGLNYAEHVKEGGGTTPTEPVIFMKASTALCGPNDSLIIPINSLKTDYEVELAIVIGKKASYINEASAHQYIAGYTLINDYSEREWQLERPASQWDKGKSANTFAPVGPYLVSPEEIGDPHNLNLWLKVNGVLKQNANTGDMIFKVSKLISDLSQYMTLLPGDIIATGTPSGVGLGAKPPKYLRPGDIVELGIEKIGSQKQIVSSALKYVLNAKDYEEYIQWVSLGLGGLPHTLEGFRTVQKMNTQLQNPLDVSKLKIGELGDLASLQNLPNRSGQKPSIAPFAVPHRQISQHNDSNMRAKQNKLFDDQVKDIRYNLLYKMSFLERNSPGIFLKDSSLGNPSLMPLSHAEIGHIHPSDGSMHIILSPSDTKEVIEKGWGELHGLSGLEGGPIMITRTYMMIYSPRNDTELAITKMILEAAVKYSCYVPPR